MLKRETKPILFVAATIVHLFLAQAIMAGPTPTPQATVTLPPDPVVARAPATAAWRIDYGTDPTDHNTRIKSPKNQGSATRNPTVRRVVVTKDGDIYHEEISYDLGPSTNSWWVNGVQVTQHSGSTNFTVSQPADADNSYQDFRKCDFPEIEWVRAANFLKIDRVDGAKCYCFRKNISLLPPDLLQTLTPDQKQKSMVEATVWIDTTTLLPVRYLYDGQVKKFVFDQSLATHLSVPDEVTRKIAELEATKAQMLRPAPHP